VVSENVRKLLNHADLAPAWYGDVFRIASVADHLGELAALLLHNLEVELPLLLL